MSSSTKRDKRPGSAMKIAFVATFVACLVLGLTAGIVGGEPLVQPAMFAILGSSIAAFVVTMLTALFDDRRRSSRLEMVGLVATGVFLAALLVVFVLGPIGSGNGWLPPMDCSLGGCGQF
jgi:FtsH-binding integral membrane protein